MSVLTQRQNATESTANSIVKELKGMLNAISEQHQALIRHGEGMSTRQKVGGEFIHHLGAQQEWIEHQNQTQNAEYHQVRNLQNADNDQLRNYLQECVEEIQRVGNRKKFRERE